MGEQESKYKTILETTLAVPQLPQQIPFITKSNFKVFSEYVKRDIELFRQNHKFHNTSQIRKLLEPQAIEGRARSGHGAFRPPPNAAPEDLSSIHCFDATIEDVVRALGKEVYKYRQERQWQCDHIFNLAEQALNGEKIMNYLASIGPATGQPLAGNEHFRAGSTYDHNIPRNSGAILLGLILASRIDSAEWRSKTEDEFNILMNKGTTQPISISSLRKHGYRMNYLANFEHAPNPGSGVSLCANESDFPIPALKGPSMRQLEEAGIVLPLPEPQDNADEDVVMGYVRHQAGFGIDDDAAMVYSGLLLLSREMPNLGRKFNEGRKWGMEDILDVCTGFYLGDFLDTFDKCALRMMPGGQDEYLGKMIVDRMRLSCEETEELDKLTVNHIYLSRISKENYNSAPNSSQRYFLQQEIDSHAKEGKEGKEGKDSHAKESGGRFKDSHGAPTTCAFEQHMEFVKRFYPEIADAPEKGWKGSCPPHMSINMGYKRVHARMFYRKIYNDYISFFKTGK